MENLFKHKGDIMESKTAEDCLKCELLEKCIAQVDWFGLWNKQDYCLLDKKDENKT
jgi:hypothetical protein